jgi:hypothetical protein
MTDTPPTDTPTPNPTAAVDLQLIADLRDRIADLEAWRNLLNEHLDATHLDTDDPVLHDDTDADTETDEGGGEGDDGVLDPDRLIGWVHRHVAAVIARPLRGEIRWCPRWWEHPEAVFRFEALRRAWTQLAPEAGVGMSVWIRDHLDPCLRELLSPLGPFVDCRHNDRVHTRTDHTPLPTLPIAVPED